LERDTFMGATWSANALKTVKRSEFVTESGLK
jgi:hypothetical protein